MGVSFTYSPDFGVKITVGLPKHVGREAGFEICDAIDALVREQLEGKEERRRATRASCPEPTEEALPAVAEPEAEENAEPRPAEWPSVGVVTASEIVAFWNIGKSSFRQRVRDGVFSGAISCPDRAPNAPKVWDAATVGRELAAAGYVRRGF
ncbi:hypothetical protein [Synergistes jonesii]|uniref:hypothetical protein n=1 Tax=Synergistes jonesii TaxID=2754 RepID=UPI00332FF356